MVLRSLEGSTHVASLCFCAQLMFQRDMKKFLLGKKQAMSRMFRDDGTVVPVTVLAAGPCVVTQVRTAKKDGYTAVQIGFGSRKKQTKAVAGHLKGLGAFRVLREFRTAETGDWERGKTIDVQQFVPGDTIKVTATSKGRGFAGVVKRHGFHGSPASHGHKDQLRKSGSIGSTAPQRVFKGMRMAGQMGNARVTVRNLEVIAVHPATNELLVKGAVPGPRNTLVLIQTQ